MLASIVAIGVVVTWRVAGYTRLTSVFNVIDGFEAAAASGV